MAIISFVTGTCGSKPAALSQVSRGYLAARRNHQMQKANERNRQQAYQNQSLVNVIWGRLIFARGSYDMVITLRIGTISAGG